MPIYKVCPKCRKNVEKYKPHKCLSKKRVRNQGVYDTARWHRLRDYVRGEYIVCARCGSIDNIQVHHIVKIDDDISKAYDIENVCLLCSKCHVYVDNNCISGTLDFKFDRYVYNITIG